MPMLFWLPAARAQVSEQEILLSDSYIFGQAYGETRDEAINNARVALIEKLVVTVTNESELNVRDDATAFESEFVSRTQTMSRMQLRGLDVMPEQRRDGSWKAIVYISEEDYRRSMDTSRDRLLRLLQAADSARLQESPAVALRDYTELLVQRPFYPLPLYADEALENAPGNDIAEFAARRIEQELERVNIEVRELQTYTDPVEIVLELRLTHEQSGRPLQEAEIRFDLSGYGFLPVNDGYVRLSLDVLPERRLASYAMQLRPAYEASDEGQASIAASVIPVVSRRLEIDFSRHISLDFSATRVGTGGYQFQPLIENIAVKEIRWDFGDGLSSRQLNPRQAFTPEQMEQPRMVSFTLNGRPELTIKKELRPDGNLYTVANPEENVSEEQDAPRHDARTATAPRDTPEEESPPAPASYRIPAAHQNVIDELLRSQRWEQAQRLLTGFQQENSQLKFGNSTSVGREHIAECYVLVLNPDSQMVEAVLSPEQAGIRQNLRNGQPVEDMRDRYSGRAPVWVLLPY
ncbi:MAG: hypothetical protein ACOC2C_02875 [Cyclonatronaceae bacterium]